AVRLGGALLPMGPRRYGHGRAVRPRPGAGAGRRAAQIFATRHLRADLGARSGPSAARKLRCGLAPRRSLLERRLVLLRRAHRRAARPNLMRRILLVAATTGYQ